MFSGFRERYTVTSNRESGNGIQDIELVKKDNSQGAIFEFKFSEEEKNLQKGYDTNLKKQGVKKTL